MDLNQFIGFLITMAAMLLMFGRKRKKIDTHPEENSAEESHPSDDLHELLKAMSKDVKKVQARELPQQPPFSASNKPAKAKKSPSQDPPRVKRLVGDEFSFKSDLDHYRSKIDLEKPDLKTNLDDRYKDPYGDRIVSIDLRERQSDSAYTVIRTGSISRVHDLLNRIPSKKEMVVMQEIMGPPKALRTLH